MADLPSLREAFRRLGWSTSDNEMLGFASSLGTPASPNHIIVPAGDGISDDTVRVQSILDTVPNNSIVEFAAGTFVQASFPRWCLKNKSGVTVKGQGRGVTILKSAVALRTIWKALTAYHVGDLVWNSTLDVGNAQYRCITAGTSTTGIGPQTSGSNITDGTVHWAWVQTFPAVNDWGILNIQNCSHVEVYDLGFLGTFTAPTGTWSGVFVGEGDEKGICVQTGTSYDDVRVHDCQVENVYGEAIYWESGANVHVYRNRVLNCNSNTYNANLNVGQAGSNWTYDNYSYNCGGDIQVGGTYSYVARNTADYPYTEGPGNILVLASVFDVDSNTMIGADFSTSSAAYISIGQGTPAAMVGRVRNNTYVNNKSNYNGGTSGAITIRATVGPIVVEDNTVSGTVPVGGGTVTAVYIDTGTTAKVVVRNNVITAAGVACTLVPIAWAGGVDRTLTSYQDLGDVQGLVDMAGTGSPEGVVTAPVGSVYRRSDGGANTTLYVKQSGTGNTGWVGK